MIDDKGEVLGGYDKIHLVPFGEYLPFQDFMESLGFMQMTGVRGGFSAGTGPRLLAVPGAPQARPLICYEIIFPDAIIEQRGDRLAAQRHQRRVVRQSAGPYQHFHQAQVRAVEQGLPVVRAANTGISAIVDPTDACSRELGLGERGVVDGLLPGLADHEIRDVGTLDRDRSSCLCASRLARFWRLHARPKRAHGQ